MSVEQHMPSPALAFVNGSRKARAPNADVSASGFNDWSLPPSCQDGVPTDLRTLAHDLARELLSAIRDELSAARIAAEAAQKEARRLGEAVDALQADMATGGRPSYGAKFVYEGRGQLMASDSVVQNSVSAPPESADAIASPKSGALATSVEPLRPGGKRTISFASDAESIEVAKFEGSGGNPSDSFASNTESIETAMFEGSTRQRTEATLTRTRTITMSTCEDLCAATESLALIAVFVLGFAFEALVDIEDDKHPLTPVYTCCLSLSASLSVFVVTFTVLECYYIHMARGALGAEGSPAFAHEFETILDSFKGWRKSARNSLWIALQLILISACVSIQKKGASDTVRHVFNAMSCIVLLGSGAGVVYCVRTFRYGYRPFLWSMHGRF